jgi:hypothetical protein
MDFSGFLSELIAAEKWSEIVSCALEVVSHHDL